MSSNATIIQAVIIWILIYAAPLFLCIVAFLAASRISRTWAKAVVNIAGLAALASFLYIFMSATPYLWACYLESQWKSANPQTREEMESHLSLYKAKEILPTESSWGKYHTLRDGDKMIQYMILWSAPLDVVYDQENKLIAAYTSYE